MANQIVFDLNNKKLISLAEDNPNTGFAWNLPQELTTHLEYTQKSPKKGIFFETNLLYAIVLFNQGYIKPAISKNYPGN